MKKILFTFFVFSIFCFCKRNSDFVLNINTEGVKYKTFILKARNFQNNKSFKISGKSENGSNWTFSIPDSIFSCFGSFMLFPNSLQKDSAKVIKTEFICIQSGDTIRYNDVLALDKKIKCLNLHYIETENLGETPIIKTDDAGNEKVFFAVLTFDKFIIPLYTNTDFEVIPQCSKILFDFISNNIDYEDFLKNYVELAARYPNSHYLAEVISNNLYLFQARQDVQKIFDKFSKDNQQTEMGQIINNYIQNSSFSNLVLPTWNSGKLESIIQDKSKINLVIFSASWCAPCIAEIPILKKIDKELGDKVSLVYISMDDTTTIEAWKKLMVSKEITWRSLLAAYNLKEIKQQFFNPALPSVLMVYPDGLFEKVDVRKDEGLKKLYQVTGKPIE